jgi:hypothetical protein
VHRAGIAPDIISNPLSLGTLPELCEPRQIQLCAGEAIFAHVLLPHRGGRNVCHANSTNDTQQPPDIHSSLIVRPIP